MRKPLSVLIIGCGNIAGGFDAARPPGASPLTHAGAFSAHGGFELPACVDPDTARREAFRARWRVSEGFSSLDEVMGRAGAFDIISICSPTSSHPDDLDAAIALRPRLIFCEKPISWELARRRAGAHGRKRRGALQGMISKTSGNGEIRASTAFPGL